MTELKESIRDSLKPLRQLDKEVDSRISLLSFVVHTRSTAEKCFPG